MKALLLTVDFPPNSGGIQRYLFNLYNNFPKNEFVVVAPKVDGWQESDAAHDLKVYREDFYMVKGSLLPKRAEKVKRLIKCVHRLLQIIKEEKIEVIHVGHSFPLGVSACLIVQRITKLDYIVFTHASEISTNVEEEKKGRVLKKFLRNAKKVITVSDYTKEILLQNGIKSENIVLIHPGINPLDASVGDYKPLLSDKKVLLTISRLAKRKGHDMVLKSIPLVVKEIPNFIYKIVGTGSQKENLEQLVENLDINKYVEFIDHIPDSELPNYYRECDIFILNSRVLENGDAEGFGIVFLEANLFGKPVIGGDSGGIPDAVEENVSGLLVNPIDIQEIADSIILLLKDQDLAEKLGKQGKQRAENLFNWDHVSKEAYRKLASS